MKNKQAKLMIAVQTYHLMGDTDLTGGDLARATNKTLTELTLKEPIERVRQDITELLVERMGQEIQGVA